MADFVETIRQLFGYDPTAGGVLGQGQISGNLPGFHAAMAAPSSPQTPEAADPSTPSPSGNVLATLTRRGTPQQSIAGQVAPPSPNAGGVNASGIGGDAVAALQGASHGESPLNALVGGFAYSQKHREDQAAQADVNALAQQKYSIDAYKSLFDLTSKQTEQRLAQAKETATETRQQAQDAETKRWHDIMAPAYQKATDPAAKASELSPKDQVLTEQRLRSMAGYDPSDKNWPDLTPQQREERQHTFMQMYQRTFGKPYSMDAGAATPPRANAAPSSPAPDEEDDAPVKKPAVAPPAGTTSRAPVAPPAQPPATSAPPAQGGGVTQNPGAWRPYRATDGKIKLFNPTTGQTQEMNGNQGDFPNPQGQ